MEFQIGDRPRRTANRFPVHADDETDERPGVRKVTQNVVPLIVKFRSVNLDEAHVVGVCLKSGLPKPTGVQWSASEFRRLVSRMPDSLYGRMLGQFHGQSPVIVYASICANKNGDPLADSKRTLATASSSAETPFFDVYHR
jgi:hypothetical protein